MALDSCSYDCCVLPPLDWDWDWDELHTTLGLGGAGTGGGGAQEPSFFFPATPAGVESPGSSSSEASSGYLQDAVADWSGRCSKRQRMAATTTPPLPRRPATVVGEDLQCLLESFWDSSAEGRGDGDGDLLPHDLNTTIIPEAEIRCSFVSGKDGAGASGREEQRGPSAQVLPLPAAQRGGGGGEEAARAAAAVVVPPPRPRFPAAVRAAAPLQKANAGADHAAARRDDRSRPGGVGCCEGSRAGAGAAATTAPGCACPSSLLAGEEKRGVGVLYPFAVVKPLGLDDSRMTTLDDVNKRILKRPARPVRHPVGPFACGPAVMAHGGLGLSGKAVVSLTKIRTGGKGTITIIRTRG